MTCRQSAPHRDGAAPGPASSTLTRGATAEGTGRICGGVGSERGSLGGRSSRRPGLGATAGRLSGCATRRCETGWRWEGSTIGLSQQAGEAGGSLTWEAPGRVGSSPDDDETGRHRQTAWARLARRRGVRVQEPVVEPPKATTPAPNLVDMGRSAAHVHPVSGWTTRQQAVARPAGRPRGRAAAYPWRGCRGIAGRRSRQPVLW
jgi:hypothetical protein